MTAEHACFRQVIARGGVGQVERCTCGTLHLVLGPLSLRLSPHHFQSLLETLLQAQSALDQQADERQSAGYKLASLLSQNVRLA